MAKNLSQSQSTSEKPKRKPADFNIASLVQSGSLDPSQHTRSELGTSMDAATKKSLGVFGSPAPLPPATAPAPANSEVIEKKPTESTPSATPQADSSPSPAPIVDGLWTGDLRHAPVGAILNIPLSNLREDLRAQPRLKIVDARVEAMRDSLITIGQEEAIHVRRSSPGSDMFDIISGHHRFRGALLSGGVISYLRAEIKEMKDGRAWLSALIINEARNDLSDYERAKAYRKALEDNPSEVPTYKALAAMLGKSPARISQCMVMLDLPERILSILDDYPELFGYRVAAEIKELEKKHADNAKIGDIIEDAVRRLIDRDADDNRGITAWVEQKLAANSGTTSPRYDPKVINDESGLKAFAIKRNKGDRGFQIDFTRRAGLTVDQAEDAIYMALKKLMEEAETKGD